MKPYTLTDAEDELRAALDSGDHLHISAASAKVDELDTPRAPVSLLSAALWFAEQGLRVFPLSPRSKVPFKGSSGCHDASTQADVITGWWTDHPDANIGIATGHLVDVVDIDGHIGQRSRVAHWDDIFARIDTDALAKVLTPRQGGMHVYVPATGDGNGANLAPGIDYRGLGGYVVAPPSVTDVGRYRFLGVPDFAALARVAA